MRATVQGRQFALLDTAETPLFTADVWRDVGHSLGHVFATGVVVLVRPLVPYATVDGRFPGRRPTGSGWRPQQRACDLPMTSGGPGQK